MLRTGASRIDADCLCNHETFRPTVQTGHGVAEGTSQTRLLGKSAHLSTDLTARRSLPQVPPARGSGKPASLGDCGHPEPYQCHRRTLVSPPLLQSHLVRAVTANFAAFGAMWWCCPDNRPITPNRARKNRSSTKSVSICPPGSALFVIEKRIDPGRRMCPQLGQNSQQQCCRAPSAQLIIKLPVAA